MAVDTSVIIDKVKDIGSVLASWSWPNDLECYMVSFELCNYEGKTLDFLSFPIMPNNIQIDESPAVSIKNTFGGVSVVSSEVYTPKTITLRGNFGRNLRVLTRSGIGGLLVKSFDFTRKYSSDSEPLKCNELSHNIKTGYGVTKILQSILNKANGVDESKGLMNKLYFYNLAFGESYVVKPINFKFSQSLENNMLWNYDVVLKTICPLELDKNLNKFKDLYTKVYLVGEAQTALNELINSLAY